MGGLFSKQAINKLSDIFDTLFTSKRDDNLPNKIDQNQTPVIKSIAPQSVLAGTPGVKLSISGECFSLKSKVFVGDLDVPITYKSDKDLLADLSNVNLAQKGTLSVEVVNSLTSKGKSNQVSLNIT